MFFNKEKKDKIWHRRTNERMKLLEEQSQLLADIVNSLNKKNKELEDSIIKLQRELESLKRKRIKKRQKNNTDEQVKIEN